MRAFKGTPPMCPFLVHLDPLTRRYRMKQVSYNQTLIKDQNIILIHFSDRFLSISSCPGSCGSQAWLCSSANWQSTYVSTLPNGKTTCLLPCKSAKTFFTKEIVFKLFFKDATVFVSYWPLTSRRWWEQTEAKEPIKQEGRGFRWSCVSFSCFPS